MKVRRRAVLDMQDLRSDYLYDLVWCALVFAMDRCPIDSMVEWSGVALVRICRLLPSLPASRIRFTRPCDLCCPRPSETAGCKSMEVAAV